MTIGYEAPELEAIEIVDNGTLTDGWSFAQDVTSGQITFAGAGTSSFSSAGVMVKVKFQLTGELSIGEHAWVNINSILLNVRNTAPMDREWKYYRRYIQTQFS